MSNADEIEDIRERKRQELMQEATGTAPTPETATSSPAPSEPIHVTGGDHLNNITAEYDVVLVDFHADWCGPCQMLEPTVKEIAKTSDAAVAKVDIDQNQALASQLGIQGVPTLFLYADGEPVERLVGVQDQATLLNLIDQYS